MTFLHDHLAFDIFGNPKPIAPLPELRIIGRGMSRDQIQMAQRAFTNYSQRASMSSVPNPVEAGRLPDGSRYKAFTVGRNRYMQVWPAAADSSKVVRSVVYWGSLVRNEGCVAFSFLRNSSGVVSYEVMYYAPYEDKPTIKGYYRYSGNWWPFDEDQLYYDAGALGVFGSGNYLFISYTFEGDAIVRGEEILKVLPFGTFDSPRKYDGLGYIAFAKSGTRVSQDDGTSIFSTTGKDLIGTYSFHPANPTVSLTVLHFPPESGPLSFSSDTIIIPSMRVDIDGPQTYSISLQRTNHPSYPRTRKEISFQGESGWVETFSELVPPNAIPASPTYSAEWVSTFLQTVKEVTGLVDITKDTPFVTRSPSGGMPQGGTCELEASYQHAGESTEIEIFGSAGEKHTVVEGRDKRCNFTASMDYVIGDTFNPYEATFSSSVDSQEWVILDGEKITTLDAQVEWSMTSTAVQATSSEGSTLAYIGNYTGSAAMDVTCLRREIIIHDQDFKFLCYLEQEFEYSWNPTAKCARMTGNGEDATPHSGAPLEGENDMVPVEEPEVYLVMKLGTEEVIREKINFVGSTYLARVSMIPATSAYIQPQMDMLPPESVDVEEYQRRVRTLLCTGYQLGIISVDRPGGGSVTTSDNYLRVRPYTSEKQHDDYFLRLGAFPRMQYLRTAYIVDSTTRSGVLIIESDNEAVEFDAIAYVITNQEVTAHSAPEGMPTASILRAT